MDLCRWSDPGSFHHDEKRKLKMTAVILVLFCALIAAIGQGRSVGEPPAGPRTNRVAVLETIRTEFGNFSRSTEALCASMRGIEKGVAGTVAGAKTALIDCRLHYKRIEYFLEYFFRSSALIYNHPARVEVEEPFMEFEAPRGFQVIESLLFQKDPPAKKAELIGQAVAVDESAKDLGALLFDFSMDDGQLLESLRIELIRVMALGIAGYDAPLLKSGIAESYEALRSVDVALEGFLTPGSREADSTKCYMTRSLAMLRTSRDFDHFDRLLFLTAAALPLQHHLRLLTSELKLELHTIAALNDEAVNLFAADALNREAFPRAVAGREDHAVAGRDARVVSSKDGFVDTVLLHLGRRLFFEKALSGNGSRSCATCHQPAKYFTDGLPKSIAYDGRSTLARNAPSLLYACFQYSQFWDGRAKTLEEQVLDVLKNPREMNADTTALGKSFSPLGLEEICKAIAGYVRTLSPMNSAFDKYMAGDRRAMAPDEIRGFNLFMGKAQCGTCHFAPLFNGLRAPFYAQTEYEVLGVPVSDDLGHPKADSDNGRWSSYPIPFYRQAFKTPTLRNIAVTGPYMHNGAFHSLESVMDFYNKGGGRGLGLGTPEQSLAARPLGLSRKEMREIEAFLRALTDNPPAK
jgi:cytochrome c peroxidase